MAVKIASLEIQNIKRVRAISLDLTKEHLTILGGGNCQGKTSVLNSIMWALGGNGFKPDNFKRIDSAGKAEINLTLSNGILVKRKGKNGSLTIIDPSGRKGGQALLNEFISVLALNIPKFLNSSDKEKAKTLLNIIGVENELAQFDRLEQVAYDERLLIGRDEDRKRKFAEEITVYDDVPERIVSVAEIIESQKAILLSNAENDRVRNRLSQSKASLKENQRMTSLMQEEVMTLQEKITFRLQEENEMSERIKDVEAKPVRVDQSTEEMQRQLDEIETINAKIRCNLDQHKAKEESIILKQQYEGKTEEIEKIRTDRLELLNSVELPLPSLSIDKGLLTYKGQFWQNMSQMEQLKVSVAIVRKLNPECGFVLLDKLEAMDLNSLHEFKVWLDAENLQVIATRVSTGDECSVIIEDGLVKEDQVIKKQSAVTVQNWGAF